MKVDVYSLSGQKKSQIDVPSQFNETVRFDLIKRAVIAQQSNSYQPHGSNKLAGTRQGEAMPKRRQKYRTTYGFGVSRIKRKIMWRRGRRFGWVGSFVANAIGGRKAFPPRAEKVIAEKINRKERRKAIRSAIAATANLELVKKRNHCVSEIKIVPLIVEDKFEAIKKSKDVKNVLIKLGLSAELSRTSKRKVRAGRGTMRGRKYKRKVGPLVVVSKKCDAIKAARNIAGADIITVDCLSAELLAPGTQPGRLAIWTKKAIEKMKTEDLFK